MDETPHEPTPNEDLEAFQGFLQGFTENGPLRLVPGGKPERSGSPASPEEDEAERALKALRRATGDLSLLCPDCDTICATHDWDVKIRDRVLKRAGELSQRLTDGIVLYFQNRGYGVREPQDLLVRVYAAWDELQLLSQAAEPQNFLDELEALDGLEDLDLDLDPEDDGE